MAKTSSRAREFMEERMHAFKEGKMHSRKTRTGPTVTNPKQGIAIALSEARKKGMKVTPEKKSMGIRTHHGIHHHSKHKGG